ncbi:MAG TPA: hypothetical protein VGK59_11020, partial [Ohtaekwangia sp.]
MNLLSPLTKTAIALAFIASASFTYGQVVTGDGMVYEDEEKHKGFVEGKLYKTDGTHISGYVSFPYTDGNISFRNTKDEKGSQKFTPEEVTGFTMVKDSFATLSNFFPERIGVTLTQVYKKGFAKVLVDGPICLFKHYSLQSMSNYRVVSVESYLVSRKEEHLSRFYTIPTRNAAVFQEAARKIFRRNKTLTAAIQSGELTFLDLREIVTRYNESYSIVERESETSDVILVRIYK